MKKYGTVNINIFKFIRTGTRNVTFFLAMPQAIIPTNKAMVHTRQKIITGTPPCELEKRTMSRINVDNVNQMATRREYTVANLNRKL